MAASSDSGAWPPFPDQLPIFERDAVRVVLLDVEDRVLLFNTCDIDHPDLGTWWELPGGGLDAGENYLDAAVREVREETGIELDRTQVSAPTWRRTASFRHRQRRHVQHEVIVTARLTVRGPGVDETDRLDYEREDYFGFRWWHRTDVVSSRERFYPGQLPRFLESLLAGDPIEEPFELWS